MARPGPNRDHSPAPIRQRSGSGRKSPSDVPGTAAPAGTADGGAADVGTAGEVSEGSASAGGVGVGEGVDTGDVCAASAPARLIATNRAGAVFRRVPSNIRTFPLDSMNERGRGRILRCF